MDGPSEALASGEAELWFQGLGFGVWEVTRQGGGPGILLAPRAHAELGAWAAFLAGQDLQLGGHPMKLF